MFGENASVDVPAAFHVSTADTLNFEDGSVFSATAPDNSTLTIAPPESFGFLGAQSASIEINGAQLKFHKTLVSLSSGNISIQGITTQDAELVNYAGEVKFTAMGVTKGDLSIAANLTTDPAGNLVMNLAQVKTSGNGGGQVIVHAGNIDMNAADIITYNRSKSQSPL